MTARVDQHLTQAVEKQRPVGKLGQRVAEREVREHAERAARLGDIVDRDHRAGTAVTLIGKAEGGKTLVGENETAVDLYLFKHNLPGYDRPTPQPKKPSKYPETKIQRNNFV